MQSEASKAVFNLLAPTILKKKVEVMEEEVLVESSEPYLKDAKLMGDLSKKRD